MLREITNKIFIQLSNVHLKNIETISRCNILVIKHIILHTSSFAGEFKPISCCITSFTFICTTAHIICVNTCVRIYRMLTLSPLQTISSLSVPLRKATNNYD